MVRHVDNCALNTKEKKMNLKYITCSDPREFNDIRDIVKLGQLSPRVEIAVQAHPSKMSTGMPRRLWFRDLLKHITRHNCYINLAVHVNREWCDEICRTGKIPEDLKEFFDLVSVYSMQPVIRRWQLNIPSETVKNINIDALKNLLNKNNDKEFIFQCNDNTKDVITKMHKQSARFSVLYDASGGRGISPKHWSAPLFSNVSQGYSGGLSPENVGDNLSKIYTVTQIPMAKYDKNNEIVYTLEDRDDIWIDAEGKLKTDDRFDIARARQYVINAENWLRQKQH